MKGHSMHRLSVAALEVGLCAPEIQLTVPPEGADLVLPSDVPDGEGDVLVLNGLDVETCIWDG